MRDIVKAYYDKKNGVKIQEYTAKKEDRPKVLPTSVDDPSLDQDLPSR